MDGYQELAYAICKSACDDYIDALILQERGWLFSPKELGRRKEKMIRKIWRAVLRYGDRRYIYHAQTDGRIMLQSQQKNMVACEKIQNLINEYIYFEQPQKTIYECEQFFRSGRFSIFMPDLDPEDLISALKEKAKRGERTVKNYEKKYGKRVEAC